MGGRASEEGAQGGGVAWPPLLATRDIHILVSSRHSSAALTASRPSGATQSSTYYVHFVPDSKWTRPRPFSSSSSTSPLPCPHVCVCTVRLLPGCRVACRGPRYLGTYASDSHHGGHSCACLCVRAVRKQQPGVCGIQHPLSSLEQTTPPPLGTTRLLPRNSASVRIRIFTNTNKHKHAYIFPSVCQYGSCVCMGGGPIRRYVESFKCHHLIIAGGGIVGSGLKTCVHLLLMNSFMVERFCSQQRDFLNNRSFACKRQAYGVCWNRILNSSS